MIKSKKKIEKFVNPIEHIYPLIPLIYLVALFFFPQVGLIINTILLTYLLYIFYDAWNSKGGGMIFGAIILLPLIIVIILQIMLLFIVSSGKKAETKDNY